MPTGGELDHQRERDAAEIDGREKESSAPVWSRETLLGTALAFVSDFVQISDTEGRFLYANPPLLRMLGQSQESVKGKLPRDLGYPEEIAARFDGQLRTVIANRQPLSDEAVYHVEGRPRYFEYILSPAFTPDGEVSFLVRVTRDITRRKIYESQALRDQRVESIGSLAGGLAHDLNNILSPILMSLELLSLKYSDPESVELLETLRSCAYRGADMVGQILTLARGIEGQRHDVRIDGLLAEVEKFVKDTFLKSIRIQSDVSRDLWTVTGDATQLYQAVLNLCLNSRDAMLSGGRLTISARNLTLDSHYAGLEPRARPGPYVALWVEDSGGGMPPEILRKVSHLSPRGSDVAEELDAGSGLSTCLAIVKDHGGFVRFYSEAGVGTRCKICLPARRAANSELMEDGEDLPRGDGQLLLFVDDEVAVRHVTQSTLETFGYRVLLAANGAEAVALYASRQSEIAAVITDLMMPVMDGVATIQVLQNINPNILIIAASGLTANAHGKKLRSLGITHFLPKPFTAHVLLKTLGQALRAKPRSG